MNFLDVMQELKAQNTRLENKLNRINADQDVRMNHVQQEFGELSLVCKTLMRILLEKQVCTGEELESLLKEIDLEDGGAEGRAARSEPQVYQCSNCNRTLQRGHSHCVYCGLEHRS